MSECLKFEEILTQILSRLPVKSIIQCRCVCKSWNSLISSSYFVTHHLETSRNKTDLLLFKYKEDTSFRDDPKELFFFYPDDGFPLNPLKNLTCPFEPNNSCYNHLHVVGSCNGLICLTDRRVYHKRAVFWNPGIRKIFVLPGASITLDDDGSYMEPFGFGFDSVSNDYKMVRLVSWIADFTNDYLDAPAVVEVYSLSRNCWKMVQNDIPGFVNPSLCAVVNGACHWVTRGKNEERVILSFDLHNEVCGKMSLPDCLKRQWSPDFDLVEFGGLLAVVIMNQSAEEGQSIWIWVMKEYDVTTSWTKLTIDAYGFEKMPRGRTFDSTAMFLTLVRSKDKILLGTSNGDMVFYDLKGKVIQVKFKGEEGSFYLNTYMDSLVLPNESNESSTEEGTDDKITNSLDDGVSNECLSSDDDLDKKKGRTKLAGFYLIVSFDWLSQRLRTAKQL